MKVVACYTYPNAATAQIDWIRRLQIHRPNSGFSTMVVVNTLATLVTSEDLADCVETRLSLGDVISIGSDSTRLSRLWAGIETFDMIVALR